MNHTSKLIKSTYSSNLEGKSIALCITGSVAAAECVALSRLLMRHGAEIHVVMSEAAKKLIHPYLMEWATGNPVVTELTGQIEHITLAGKHDGHVDLALIAPSTANTIGKIANGIDDTSVTTTISSAIGTKIPVVIVPAMHESMYDHPAVIENIQKLKQMGIHFVEPRMEEAKAKFPNPEDIVAQIISLIGPKDFNGINFVITAGPTQGWIDRVRYITNPSTGKMGIAIANEIVSRGGNVKLILGPTMMEPPSHIDTIRVTTSDDMLEATLSSLDDCDVFISSAAVLDYKPSKTEDRKIPSKNESLTIDLVPTKKIIEEVRKKYGTLFIVGFKVESGVSDDELEARAIVKIDEGICNIVVANDAARKGVAFGGDTNEVLIVGKNGVIKKVPLVSKRLVAKEIMDLVKDMISS